MTNRSKARRALQSGQAAVAGIDLGNKHSEICWLDANGEVVERRRIATSSVELEKTFGGQPALVIAIETGMHANWVRRRLEALGHLVYVADAKRVKLIWETKSKDDRRDAQLLAEVVLRWPELLHAVPGRSLESEHGRALLTLRAALVDARTELINSVRGVTKSFGEKLPAADTAAFARKAGPALPAELRELVHATLLVIEQMSAQIAVYDKQVLKLCDGPYAAATRRLRSIPGVGPLTALAFVLELDNDPGRLRNSRAAGALVGLRPGRKESGESKPELGITKTGNRMLRRYLVQCAHYMLGAFGKDCALRRWGLGLAGRRSSKRGKRCAIVATARKLAVLLHTLWRKDQDFDPSIGLEQAAA
jgi:transposase